MPAPQDATTEPSAALIAAFQGFVGQAEGPPQLRFLQDHPLLAWPGRWPELEAWIDGQPPERRDALEHGLGMIAGFAAAAQHDMSIWQANGPIEQLAARVAGEQLTPAQAIAAAADPAIVGVLGPIYLEGCAIGAFQLARDGDFRKGVLTFQILLAAFDQLGEADGWGEAPAYAAIRWIDTASLACNALPDGRWLRDAKARGEAMLASAAVAANPALQGNLLHELGVLHLDPYTAGRSSHAIETWMRQWRERLAMEYGEVKANSADLAMPEPQAAMDTAIAYLRRALPLRQGEWRGQTQKAIAEALVWRGIFGGPEDKAAAIEAAQEALKLISPQRNPERIAAVTNLLKYLGQTPGEDSPQALADLASADPAALIAQVGETTTFERYDFAIANTDGDPIVAIGLLGRIWPLLVEPRHGAIKARLTRSASWAFDGWAQKVGALPAPTPDLTAVANTTAETATREHWSSEQFAAVFAGIALSTIAQDREVDALPLIAAAIAAAQSAQTPWAGALNVIQADLMVGAAVNALNAKDPKGAVSHYGDALRQYVRIGLLDELMELLVRLEDVAFKNSVAEVTAFALYLADSGPLLEASEAPGVRERLQMLWRRVFGQSFDGESVNQELLVFEFQAAKGGAFALSADATDWRTDDGAVALLQQIDAAGPESIIPVANAQLDDEYLLCGYASHVATTASGPAATLARLQQRFDARIRQRVALSAEPLKPLLKLEDLQRLVGPKTVLLTHYYGQTKEGRSALFTLLVTAETIFLTGGLMQLPIGAIRMQGDDREVDIQPLGLTVAALRRDVVAEPGPAVVDSEAEAQLRTDTNTLGGGLADKLAELRKAGKDHLCIHPHGAFHFHPMHLIGDPGTCLADDWTVTKLAHPSLLARRDNAPATAASVPLAAFGMGFEGGQPHGLAPLPAACDEASTVSRLMQGECYLNEQATERQFIASLRAARRIHVATHGAHRVGAPVFQRVYLNPADGSDGIFHAYEVVGMDLRHVELVTLSACETALGRFDEGDNLRGLSASLLAAGVGTIVSTLWPIVDEVSQTFFIALYTALAQDPDRLAAFRTAQLATRAAFPAYRDWGAFQYLGAW